MKPQTTTLAQRFYPYSWVSLIFLYPFIFFMRPVLAPALLWLPVLALWRWRALGLPLPKTRFSPALLPLTIMLAVSVWATPDVAFSLPKIAGLLFGITVFFSVYDVATYSPDRLWLTVGLFLLLASGFVIVGFLNFYPPIADRLPSQIALEVNPNEVAGILTYSWPLLLALTIGPLVGRGAHYTDANYVRWIWVGIGCVPLLIGLVILYLSTSRGGQLGILVAIGAVAILSARRFRWLMWLASVAGLVLAVAYVMQFETALAPSAIDANASLEFTVANRLIIWSSAVQGIQDFPLTGMGMNIFRSAQPLLYPIENIPLLTDLAHAHNHLLQAALDLGLPGMIAYLALWLVAVHQLFVVLRTSVTPQLRFLAIGLCAALLAHFTFGMTDAIALGAKPGFLLWMLFGITAALPKHAPQ